MNDMCSTCGGGDSDGVSNESENGKSGEKGMD